jgi:hypothetical protein
VLVCLYVRSDVSPHIYSTFSQLSLVPLSYDCVFSDTIALWLV